MSLLMGLPSVSMAGGLPEVDHVAPPGQLATVPAGAGGVHGHGLPGIYGGYEGGVEGRDPTGGMKPVEYIRQPFGCEGLRAPYRVVQCRPNRMFD